MFAARLTGAVLVLTACFACPSPNAALPGPAGATGSTGPMGTPGATGAIGPTGATGPAAVSERRSVRDFGAVGDGVTDDFPAFRAALAAIPAAGGALWVPGGERSRYLLKLQSGAKPVLALRSNVTVHLDADATILREAGPSMVNGYSDALFINASASTGSTNITIEGGRLKGAGPGQGGVFIAMYGVRGLVIRDIQLLDTDESARLQVSHCEDVIISGVRMAYEESWSGVPSFEDGLRIGSGCRRVAVSNVMIESGDDAIAISNEPSENEGNSTVGADISDVAITNAVVRTRLGHALRVFHATAMTAGTIRRVVVTNLVGDVRHEAGNDGIVIIDYSARDAISDVRLDGVALRIDGPTNNGCNVGGAHHVTVSNSTFTGYGLFGVSGADAGFLTVHDVTVSPRGDAGVGDGVFLKRSIRARLEGVRVLGSTRDGLGLEESGGAVLQGNFVEGAARDGLSLLNTNGTSVLGNRVLGVQGVGLRELGSTQRTLCVANDFGDAGIAAASAATGVYSGNLP